MKKKPKAIMTVRIEPDVEKEVRKRKERNGRTVQGEVNTTLRKAYVPYEPSINALYDDLVARRKEFA